MILFTRNGSSQGPAFTDIPEGTYYPAASLFTLPEQSEGATVEFNFGPDFKYPPPQVCGSPQWDPSAQAMLQLLALVMGAHNTEASSSAQQPWSAANSCHSIVELAGCRYLTSQLHCPCARDASHHPLHLHLLKRQRLWIQTQASHCSLHNDWFILGSPYRGCC
jgi:hypothetical protein